MKIKAQDIIVVKQIEFGTLAEMNDWLKENYVKIISIETINQSYYDTLDFHGNRHVYGLRMFYHNFKVYAVSGTTELE